MLVNELPGYDITDKPTGCCPRFDPEGWDGQELHFRNKPFVRAETRSFMHVPLNMGRVFPRVLANIEDAGAFDREGHIVLSREVSPWQAEHFFAVSKPVDSEEMTTLSGDFFTRVFEGPFSEIRKWCAELETLARARGRVAKGIWFYYTTCPKCAKAYGANYVVGLVEV